MMYRLLFFAVVVLWLVAMGALVNRDVWPALTAQDSPKPPLGELNRSEQFAIKDVRGDRIGTAWGVARRGGSSGTGYTTIEGTILLEGLAVIPRVLIETTTEFDVQGELDNFNLDLYGVPMTTIRVHGERYGKSFPCELQVGPMRRQASLDMAASRMIGDSLRPFALLPDLRVGQAWRMQVLDPLSIVQNRRAEFRSVVAQVTGKEVISTAERPSIECFVVEIRDQGSKAWVAGDGHVIKQETQIPGLGKITVEAEKFDEKPRTAARDQIKLRLDKRGHHGTSN